ncbi:uncharacterized protein [Solanum lycopersicum]|uniref:uncharacterized protein n=1 Tax=Solanum lycopersicum TaxID=4081 RepID=UPI00374790CA
MSFVVKDEIKKDEEMVETSGELADRVKKEAEVPQKVVPMPNNHRIPSEIGVTEDGKYWRFITMLNQLSINVPFSESLNQIPAYGEFMKYIVTKKRSVSFEDDDRIQYYSDIATRSLLQKKEDPNAFTIPCTIRLRHYFKALYDLGANINLMPLSIYKKLGLGDPTPNAMRLLTADGIVKRPIGILHDVITNV